MLSIYSKLKEGRLRRGRFLPPPRYSNPTPARLIPTPAELGPGPRGSLRRIISYPPATIGIDGNERNPSTTN